MAPTRRIVVLPSHVARLKGRKILVPGNHERCWAGHSGHIGKRADYYQIGGIDEIIDRPDPHTVAGQLPSRAITHTFTRSYWAQTNVKTERSNRTLTEESLYAHKFRQESDRRHRLRP